MHNTVETKPSADEDLRLLEFDLDLIAEEMAAIPVHKRKVVSQLTVFDVDRCDRAFVANAIRDKDTTERLVKTMNYLGEMGFTRPYAPPADDWAVRMQALKNDFPNFIEVIESLVEPHTILTAMGHKYRMPPLLLVGPTGVGKTLFARALQQLWRVPLRFIDMASQSNNSALSGSSTFWANASPGQLFEILAWGHAGQAPVANPILILDEVDKVHADRFDPLAALYSLLEEDTAKSFQDQALPNVSIDASHVRFVLTANEISHIAHSGAGVLTSFSRLIVLGIVIVPSVYFGQKLLIDGLVDSASTKQRATAALASQIPVALLWDAVTLKGLELPTQVWTTPEGKTFLAVLPLLAYNSPDLIGSVEKQLRPLVARVVKERVGTPEDAYNLHYVPVANEIRERWSTDYRSASQAIANATAQQGTTDELWRDYMIEIGKQPFTEESATPAQRSAVIKRLHQRGVNVPDNWQLYDQAGFEAALPSHGGGAEFRQQMDSLMGHPTKLPPGLSWVEFSNHPDVQKYVKDKLQSKLPGVDLIKDKLSLDAGIQAFESTIFTPHVTEIIDREVTRIKLPEQSYGSKNQNFEFGRQAMRAVIVPPIALAFSLCFGLSNLAGLVALLVPGHRVRKYAIQIVFMGAVLLIPLLLTNQVNRTDAYLNLEDSLNHRNPSVSVALNWLMHAQPIYYALGHAVGLVVPVSR